VQTLAALISGIAGSKSTQLPHIATKGSVSKVEMMTPMALLCKVLFPSISTFETPPK
jgi:hypothetical protein